MAEFHAYAVSINTTLMVPADAIGNPTPLTPTTAQIGVAVRKALDDLFAKQSPAIGPCAVTMGSAVEYPAAP